MTWRNCRCHFNATISVYSLSETFETGPNSGKHQFYWTFPKWINVSEYEDELTINKKWMSMNFLGWMQTSNSLCRIFMIRKVADAGTRPHLPNSEKWSSKRSFVTSTIVVVVYRMQAVPPEWLESIMIYDFVLVKFLSQPQSTQHSIWAQHRLIF